MDKNASTAISRARYFVSHIVSPSLDLTIFSDDLSVWASSVGPIGRSRYLDNLKAAHGIWSVPLKMTIDQVIHKHQCVVVTSRSKGVFLTGEEYGNEYLFVIDIAKDGRICSIREYFDHERVERVYRPAVQRMKQAR